MTHSNKAIDDYIDSFEETVNGLAVTGSLIVEDMQIALFIFSFGDPSRPRYGHIVTSLQILHDDLSWDTVTACLPKAYEPSKVKLLRIKRGRCVAGRSWAGDGPLTCFKLYLEYNAKIFQLILL